MSIFFLMETVHKQGDLIQFFQVLNVERGSKEGTWFDDIAKWRTKGEVLLLRISHGLTGHCYLT